MRTYKQQLLDQYEDEWFYCIECGKEAMATVIDAGHDEHQDYMVVSRCCNNDLVEYDQLEGNE